MMSLLKVDVLIVDDDDDLAQLFKLLLETEGYVCSVAHNGLTALQAISIIRPRLMLLDLVMPILDGFAVLERLESKETPIVIVVTGAAAFTGVHNLTNGMKSRVHDVLQKPVSADLLVSTVRRQLH